MNKITKKKKKKKNHKRSTNPHSVNKFKNKIKYISSNKIKLIPKHRNARREKEVET